MLFLIYDRWKDPNGSGPADHPRAAGVRAAAAHRLGPGAHRPVHRPRRGRDHRRRASARPSWGFRLRVVGGNAEAARRAGLKVGCCCSRRWPSAVRSPASAGSCSSPAPSSSCGPGSSPPTATSASWPAGSAATNRSACSSPSLLLVDRHRRRQPADRRQLPGRQRQRPDGPDPADGLRVRHEAEGEQHEPARRGPHRRRPRRHVDPVRRPRRDGRPSGPAWSTSAPRARCCAAPWPPTPSPSETGQPWVGVLGRRRSPAACSRWSTPTSCSPARPTSWPPAWSCCSSASG